MQGSVLKLLETRDAYDAAAWRIVQPLWADLQRELGVPEDLREAGPVRIDLEGNRLAFNINARVPATSIEKERLAVRRISVPNEALDHDLNQLQNILRREFPLVCGRCGIFHPPGTRRCDSAAKCWGWISWRSESPRPKYYVESTGNYGYYNPGTRGLRYVIDLDDYTIFGIQITLPRADKWMKPIPEVTADVIRRISENVGSDIVDIFTRPNTYADPSCLSFEPPTWCTVDEPRFRVSTQPSRQRLLTA
jgi:hypothetical protein